VQDKQRIYQIEQTVGKNYVYHGRIINVRVDDALDCYGKPIKREVVEHSGGVGVIALDGDDILLVSQFRYGIGHALLEIPAGKLERGEDPLECGKRELTEETGYEAEEWMDLGLVIPTPAYDSERIYIYMARGLTYRGQRLDESECVEVVRIELDDALMMVLKNEITDAKTQVAILKAYHWNGSRRQKIYEE
jgi:ADP-ribose pyrophosphatase